MRRKIAIIDSSVLLSLYLRDNLYSQSKELLMGLAETHKLLLPDIVFCEIINVLFRENRTESEVHEIILDIYNSDIKIIKLNNLFWINQFINLAKTVRLKSNDLMILSYVKQYKPNKFLTFDKTLSNAYNLITEYEKE